MVELRNIQVVGLERSILAAANSYSSGEIDTTTELIEHDYDRANILGGCSTGEGHDSFLKGIDVYMDIKYPQYWTPQMQRYHWMDILSSQSKMHCLCKNAKDKNAFKDMFNKYVDQDMIDRVAEYADHYNETPKKDAKMKYYWFMKTLSNLPSGYEIWMTVKTNYLQLKTVYQQRHMHPLKEDWREGFCEKIEELPMFMDLCGFNKSRDFATALNKLKKEVDKAVIETETPDRLSYMKNICSLAVDAYDLERNFIKKVSTVIKGNDKKELQENLYWSIIHELERYMGYENNHIQNIWEAFCEEMGAKYDQDTSKWQDFHIQPFPDDLWKDGLNYNKMINGK